jgi:hypothetical protein
MKFSCFTLAALLVASSAAAEPAPAPEAGRSAASQTQSASEAADPAERKICVREEATGTRLRARRVCRTASQWRERRWNS